MYNAPVSLIQNKKAFFDYTINERYEAGIELLGVEVKALRAKHASLEGSHVTVRGGEAYLIGATINPYQPNNMPKDYDATRNRRILLTKEEIAELAKAEDTKGLTIVPISVYNKNRKLKVELGIGVKKKTHDKRETLKKREADRDIARDIKGFR